MPMHRPRPSRQAANTKPSSAPDRVYAALRESASSHQQQHRGQCQAKPTGECALPRFAVVTVTIDAKTYVIVDIGMRMLTPRELARCQGFPDDYVLDPIGPSGKPLSKAAQIRMIGNSVCPGVAEAIVRANLPELFEQRESEVEAA